MTAPDHVAKPFEKFLRKRGNPYMGTSVRAYDGGTAPETVTTDEGKVYVFVTVEHCVGIHAAKISQPVRGAGAGSARRPNQMLGDRSLALFRAGARRQWRR
jgi:hypothetical protein